MEITALRIDEVAEEIARWEVVQQEALIKKLADLNYRRGLKKLSEKIRKRLAAEDRLNQTIDEIFAEMARIREKVAADDYHR